MAHNSTRESSNPSWQIGENAKVALCIGDVGSEKGITFLHSLNSKSAIESGNFQSLESDCVMQFSDDHHNGAFAGMIATSVLFALLSSMVCLAAGGGYVSAVSIYCIASIGIFLALCVVKLLGKQSDAQQS